ncbi:MAG: glycosyltransferase [Clostridia bacterium]|nr:glycosyltransferase [Clostridia bacterium]
MKVTVVIPVYNEEKRIANTAQILDSFLKATFDDYEIIFSNDGSIDNTLTLAKELESKYDKIKCVSYDVNRGKGGAVRNGILASDSDYVFYTDCDLAYGTDVIKRGVDMFLEYDADVIIGSRNLNKESYENYTFMRKMMSKVYFKMIALISGFSHSDSQCGFKGFKTGVAHTVFKECVIDSFAFDLEALIKAEKKGYKVEELPVKIINHDENDSKVRPVRDTLKMLKDIRKIKKSM